MILSRTAGLIGLAGLVSGCGREAVTVKEYALPQMGAESADPSLALDPDNGDLVLSWVAGDSTGWSLYFARSADTGTTWSPPVVVAGGGHEVHPHGESSPRLVAASGGRFAVAWVNSIPVEGRQWPAAMMRFSRSLDGGRTWSAPITLNDDTTGALVSHQFHGAAWQGDSGIVVTWLDERKGPALAIHHAEHDSTAADVTSEPDAMIYRASSPDFGGTWSANTPLWGQVCPCCRVTLARDPEGRVQSAWRKHFPGNIRDVVVAPADSGVQPIRVHNDEWVYPGCPHTGPGIAVSGTGERHIVWYMGKEGSAGVYYRKLAPDGAAEMPAVTLLKARTLPTAHASVSALSEGGAIAAYDIDIRGDRRIGVTRILPDGNKGAEIQVAGSEGGLYPQLVTIGPGEGFLAWTASAGDVRRIKLARINFPGTGNSQLTLKE